MGGRIKQMEIKRSNRQKVNNSVKAENILSFILYTDNPENVFYGKEYGYKDSIQYKLRIVLRLNVGTVSNITKTVLSRITISRIISKVFPALVFDRYMIL